MTSVIINDNYCDRLDTIPQFSGTCWFNSIITVMLYSQGLRKELSKIFKGKRKDKDDKLLNFILYMLRNYNDIEKLKTVYEDINNLNLKPEYLLVSYLKKYDTELLNNYIYDITVRTGYYANYIYKILLNYKIPFISLKYNTNNNKIYSDEKLISISNILLIEYVEEINDEYIIESGINNFDKFIEDIKHKKSIIKINKAIYKLDSCIVYSLKNKSHIIAGITCNNNKYIVDSLDKYNKSSKINSKLYKYKYSTCKPILYRWDLLSTFCITTQCNTYNIETDDNFCYNANSDYVILIYIKSESEIESSSIIFDESSLISKDFKFTKEEKSLLIIDIYSNLNLYSYDEIAAVLEEYKYSTYYLDLIENNINTRYCLLYEKLVKKPLDKRINKEILLKDIYIKLLEKYLKKGLIYNIEEYTDDNTIYKEIKKLSLETEDILFDIYGSDYIEEIILSNTNEIYNFLFINKEAFYDKLIKNIKANKNNKEKQIIIKLLILKEFFNINYNKKLKEINYKKEYGKEMRSRTSSSNKSL